MEPLQLDSEFSLSTEEPGEELALDTSSENLVEPVKPMTNDEMLIGESSNIAAEDSEPMESSSVLEVDPPSFQDVVLDEPGAQGISTKGQDGLLAPEGFEEIAVESIEEENPTRSAE